MEHGAVAGRDPHALMGLLVTSLSVAREREMGTFEQLLVSPLSPGEIIIGKTVPALLIGIGEATGMVLVGVFLFRVPLHGSVRCCIRAWWFICWPSSGWGCSSRRWQRRSSRPSWGAFSFMVPAILLSGFASPIENMPDWLQYVTLANPIRYFIVIVKGIFLKTCRCSIVLENLWPMAVIGTITLSGPDGCFGGEWNDLGAAWPFDGASWPDNPHKPFERHYGA